MSEPAIRDDDEPDTVKVMELVDRLPPEFRELVCEHYAEEPWIVDKLIRLLAMTPQQQRAEVAEVRKADYGSCGERYANWEVIEAYRLIKWVRQKEKWKAQDDFNDRLLGKGWRERAEQQRREKNKIDGLKRRF